MRYEVESEGSRCELPLRELQILGATLGRTQGKQEEVVFVDHYGDGTDCEKEALRNLGLADLTAMPRRYYPAEDGKQDTGIAVEFLDGGALRIVDGEGARIVLSNFDGELPEDEGDNFTKGFRKNSFWYRLSGQRALECLQEISASNPQAQQALAEEAPIFWLSCLGCLVVREDLGDVPAYHLVGERDYANYAWNRLMESFAGRAGQAVGLMALLSTARGVH